MFLLFCSECYPQCHFIERKEHILLVNAKYGNKTVERISSSFSCRNIIIVSVDIHALPMQATVFNTIQMKLPHFLPFVHSVELFIDYCSNLK